MCRRGCRRPALVTLYVLIAAAGPSIVRAGVAGLLIAAAWLVSRPTLRWHLLLFGAAVVLAFNPLELFDPGFQLSFAAVIAIYEVAPRLPSRLGPAVAVSVACTLVTTPIAWWHFGRLAPLSVPANLLALPVVAPILWLGITATVVGSVVPPAGAPAARACECSGRLSAVGLGTVLVNPIGMREYACETLCKGRLRRTRSAGAGRPRR